MYATTFISGAGSKRNHKSDIKPTPFLSDDGSKEAKLNQSNLFLHGLFSGVVFRGALSIGPLSFFIRHKSSEYVVVLQHQ